MVSRLAQRAQVHQEQKRRSLPPESLSAPTARRRRRSKNRAPAYRGIDSAQCNFFSKTIGFFSRLYYNNEMSPGKDFIKSAQKQSQTRGGESRANETGKYCA